MAYCWSCSWSRFWLSNDKKPAKIVSFNQVFCNRIQRCSYTFSTVSYYDVQFCRYSNHIVGSRHSSRNFICIELNMAEIKVIIPLYGWFLCTFCALTCLYETTIASKHSVCFWSVLMTLLVPRQRNLKCFQNIWNWSFLKLNQSWEMGNEHIM